MRQKKKRMKTFVIFAFAILFGAASSILLATALAAAICPVEIRAYLYDPCGGCTAEEGGCKPCEAIEATALAILEGAEARGIGGRVEFTVENLATERVRSRVAGLCGGLALDLDSLSLPLVVVGEHGVYQGDGAVEMALDSVAHPLWGAPAKPAREPELQYFYSALCADCRRAALSVEAVAALLAERGATFAEYDVDTGEGAAAFARLREQAGEAAVPALVWEGAVYTGSGEIEALLALLHG